MSGSTVAEFYSGRSILVTGGTGFMGKVLLEKLLRSCPDIANIYLLMRPKRSQDVETRLQALLQSQLFDALKEKSSDSLKRLHAVEGDITLPQLGLSAESAKLLTENVSVVFHSAATVKFDEALKLSIQMNVQGTRSLLELCHKMEKLVALIHVSTAYCNCDCDEITENIYPVPVDPYKLLQLVEWMDDDDVDYLTPRLLGKRPNTYTFTKAIAEKIVTMEAANLPYCIVRPSIVGAAWKEPIPGWVDNLNGPTGVIVGTGKGVLRTMMCHGDYRCDIIPVDVPINLLIVSAWYIASQRCDNGLIFNCVSSVQNPLLWNEFRDYGMEYLKTGIMNDILFYPDLDFFTNKYYYNASLFIKETIPSHVMDMFAWLAGQKVGMVRVYDKMHKAINCLQYFTTHEWTFKNDNVQALWNELSVRDQKTFDFDVSSIDWKQYMLQYLMGIKKFTMKEDVSTLPYAKKKLNRVWWLYQCIRVLVVVVTWRLVMIRSVSARQAWAGLLRMLLRMITYLPFLNRI